ncbi:MAG: transglycosylase SLT domain-containing protein, partial [Bacteroidia bacterium]|nr:transglycosylase SLT domain-containing protein [Bacteroidia bacterium]
AAVRYLAKLYDQFQDWNLVLLAYNAGPGKLKSAIRKSNSTDVQDLLPYLPKQTRKYLPFYTATVYALNYYNLYSIKPELEKPSLAVSTGVDKV